jgi:hypothetical protein
MSKGDVDVEEKVFIEGLYLQRKRVVPCTHYEHRCSLIGGVDSSALALGPRHSVTAFYSKFGLKIARVLGDCLGMRTSARARSATAKF